MANKIIVFYSGLVIILKYKRKRDEIFFCSVRRERTARIENYFREVLN